jgi:S1-C subfamily serine protease
MKANHFAWMLLLPLLVGGCGQQPSSRTTQTTTNSDTIIKFTADDFTETNEVIRAGAQGAPPKLSNPFADLIPPVARGASPKGSSAFTPPATDEIIAPAARGARQVAQNSFPSVVLLVMEDANGQPVALGSGFFVRENVVASNFHVVEGASRGYAKLIGKKTKYDITGLVGVDTMHDLVLLNVTDAKSPSLPLADSRQVAVGDEVFAVGNPQGLEGTFSQGIVSSIRNVESETLLQITAPISPGSSGGPVLNSEGKVIGIAVATFTGGQNLNFAVPANYLASLLAATNANPVTPLGSNATTKRGKSILDDLGGRSTEGVTGGKLTWENDLFDAYFSGNFSFTLQNKLHDNVKNVYCLVIFYDRNDSPLDIVVTHYPGTIPGGLGKRVTGDVDKSVKRLTTGASADFPNSSSLSAFTPSTKVEFRVLDFKIEE